MNEEKNYYRVLANLLKDILKINSIDKDYIKLTLDIIKKYFEADYCTWINVKEEDNKKIISNNKYEKIKLINISNTEEELIVLNSKIDNELENFLIEELKPVLNIIRNNVMLISNLKSEAYTDVLTNIANNNVLEKLLAEQKNFDSIGVCFIDANGLGIINNLYGHEEGDKMLITIANTIKKHIKKTDIYKKGGDEFIVICENITEELFNSKIESIKRDLRLTPYSASFGSEYKDKTDNLLELIKIADERMYIEKEKYRLENPDKYSIKR